MTPIPKIAAVAALAASLAACATVKGPVVSFEGRAPVWEQPAQPAPGGNPAKVLAIWYSGDGGFGHIDRAVIPMLAARGVPSVEVNSKRYFWTRRSLPQATHDLDDIIAHYTSAWGARQVVLVGYSFGGGAVPMIAPHLSPESRARIREIVLLAPVDHGQLVLRPWTWLGVNQPEAVPTSQLVKDSPAPVVCISGAVDHIAACPQLVHTPWIWMETGHLFKGKHQAVADAILHSIYPWVPRPTFEPMETD